MKICNQCGAEKPLDEYPNRKGAIDGKRNDCKVCHSARSKTPAAIEWRKNNLDRGAAAQTRYRKKHPEKARACMAKSRIKYKEKYALIGKKWRENNPEIVKARNAADKKLNKEKHKIVRAKYLAANPHLDRANVGKRRASRLNATPLWVEKSAIEWLYLDSVTNPAPHNVDHVIPLRGAIVCGLHCLDNLEVIPAHDNFTKSNKFDQDIESARQLTFTRQKLAAA